MVENEKLEKGAGTPDTRQRVSIFKRFETSTGLYVEGTSY